MKGDLSGVFVIPITPLDEKRRLDRRSLEHMLDYYVEAGVYGLLVLGEVSEASKLSADEQQSVVETAVERVRGRIPIVVGVSRESTDLVIDAAGWAEGLGASALMVAPPKNLRLGEASILAHYAAIGDATGLPLVVQDEPESNHPFMSAELLARIFAKVPGARYLKLEDPPTPAKILKIRDLTKDGMKIFGGTHGRWFLWEIDSGSTGIMTASPTPEYLLGIWRACMEGRREEASKIFFYNQALTYFYPEMAVAVKKEVLVKRGVIRTGHLKQPAGEFGDLERRQLYEVLKWVEDNVRTSTGLAPLRWKSNPRRKR